MEAGADDFVKYLQRSATRRGAKSTGKDAKPRGGRAEDRPEVVLGFMGYGAKVAASN